MTFLLAVLEWQLGATEAFTVDEQAHVVAVDTSGASALACARMIVDRLDDTLVDG